MTGKSSPAGAILQRDRRTYAIVPRIPGGLLDLEILQKFSAVVEKYQIPIAKITSGQRIALVGMEAEQVESIWNDLDLDIGKATEPCLHYVQTCPGNTVCKFGVQDSLGFGIDLEHHFSDKDFPAKMKFGVSGCPFTCAESMVRDVGVIGKKKGWSVYFGGSSTRTPRVADLIAEDLSDFQAKALIERCLDYYIAQAKTKERTARFMQRIGLETFKQSI